MDSNNTQTVRTYDEGVDLYAEAMNSTVDGKIKAWIDQSLQGLPKDEKIFEIGSGTGRDMAYMRAAGHEPAASDVSQGFIKYLSGQGIQALHFNALTNNFPDPHYGLIFADAVFLHFSEEELEKLLVKIHRALKPNGRLSFSLKMGDGEEVTYQKLNGPRYFHYWQQDSIEELLNEASFTDISYDVSNDRRPDKPQWLLVIAKKGDQK